MGIFLSIFGFGKMIFQFVLDIVKQIFAFMLAKPWIAATIALSLALGYCSYTGNETHKKLVATELVVVQQKTLVKKFQLAYNDEHKLLVTTIKTHNNEVLELKKIGDEALARAKEEAAKNAVVIRKYQTLSVKYSIANSSEGTAEERIAREEKTNDQFFQEFKEIR